jgi:aminoglycoside 6'-N-acetyltransferase I
MQKAGLRYEGTSIQSDWNNQGICDAANYALLAQDYFCKPPPARVVQAIYRNAGVSDIDAVTDLSCELYDWLQLEREELLRENKTTINDNRQEFFLAYDKGNPIGFVHVALRSEYVNGTESDGTCGYLEAIYVKPEYRKNGVAATLVRLCEEWARERGCREFASDCLLHNTDSYLFHGRIGFAETERCIFFRKDI